MAGPDENHNATRAARDKVGRAAGAFLITVLAATTPALSGIERVFAHRETFLELSESFEVTDGLQGCSGLTCGLITFSTGFIDDWTPLLAGDELAVSGLETLEISLGKKARAFGIELVKPDDAGDPPGCQLQVCNGWTYEVLLRMGGPRGTVVGATTSPPLPTGVAHFIGLSTSTSFDHVEIRQTAADPASTFFGATYLATQPQRFELAIASHTTLQQTEVDVAVGPRGDSVVVWTSAMAGGGSGSGDPRIRGRRFASSGAPLGADFPIESSTAGTARDAAAGVDADGRFVVTWQGRGTGGVGSGTSIQARRFAPSGDPAAAQFQVSERTGGQYDPAIALGPDGSFTIVWASFGSSGSDQIDSSIQGQRFDAEGHHWGAQFQINSATPGPQESAAIAMGPAGESVVVWTSFATMNPIRGQRYDPDGLPVAGEFQVSAPHTVLQYVPDVAIGPKGDFMVVWLHQDFRGVGVTLFGKVLARAYSFDGQAMASELQINSNTLSRQLSPSVGSTPRGDFVVAWNSYHSLDTDFDDFSVQARRVDPVGNMTGSEFQINTYTTSRQLGAAHSVGPRDFIVVWSTLVMTLSDEDIWVARAQLVRSRGSS